MLGYLPILVVFSTAFAAVFGARLIIRSRRSSDDEMPGHDWLLFASFAIIAVLGFFILAIRGSDQFSTEAPVVAGQRLEQHMPSYNLRGRGDFDMDID